MVIKFMRFDFGFLRQIGGRTAAFLSDGSGNVAITLAVCLVPMMLAVGASLDYARAYNVQCKMQSDLDAALVATIKQIDKYDEDRLR